ncbi:MAG: type II CAAX endopeptidase family protein [Candidatus Nomurabacteria bacterium]|nr:type II CAAX endopeptidase family protein [Candidatus Nomurabacteria bacterium]
MNDQIKYIVDNIKTSKRELIFQILIVFILPVLFIDLGIISPSQRVYLLVILVSLLMVVLTAEKWTFLMLGISKYRIKKYIIPYTIFTLVAIVLVSFFGEKIGQEEVSRWWTHSHFIYGFFIVSLFQEVGYRGYLIPALSKLIPKPWIVVTINALIFMFLHSIFPNTIIGLPLAFIGGLGFAIMYMKYPSLILIILSHSLINFFVVLYGFFVIPGVTY